MRIHRFLSRRLNIEPGEGSLLFLLAFSQFLLIGGTAVIGRTAGRALFLSSLPPQYFPFRYIAVTAGLVLSSMLYAAIARRFRRDRLIKWTSMFMIGGLLLYRYLIETSLANNFWMLGSFYVFLEIVVTLTIFQFWTFTAEIVTTRQAKRLFPTVNAAGNLGSMLAGASITSLVPMLGTSNLLVVLAAILAIYIVLMNIMGRQHFKPSDKPTPQPRKNESKPGLSWQYLSTSPLLAMMTVIAVLISLTVNMVDYQFDLSLKSSFATNPQGVSAYLGSFFFWTGIVGLGVQLFLSGPLLRRFGIGIVMMLLPLGIMTGSAASIISGAALWAITMTRASDTIFRYTIHDTSFNLLYVPIDQETRSQAKVAIDGIFKPLTIGLAGLLFLLVNHLVGIAILPWSFATLLLVALVVFILVRLRPVYLKTLQDSIRRRYFDPASARIDLDDQTTIAVIKEALHQTGEAQLLHALALTEEITGWDWTPELLSLIEHESWLVRREALRMLRRSPSAENASRVRDHLNDPNINVQASAVFTYWALLGDDALEEMQPYMEHPQPIVRTAAVSGALRYGGQQARQVAPRIFDSLVAHPEASVRMSAAYSLGELPGEQASEQLRILLEDPDPQVRLQAVQSARKLNDKSLIPAVLDQLTDPAVGNAAQEALVTNGEEIFPHLNMLYTESGLHLDFRRQIPRLVARIPTAQSQQFLIKHLNDNDDLTRARFYIALGRLRQAGLEFPDAGQSTIDKHFEQEAYVAYQLAIQSNTPQPGVTRDLLEDTAAWRLRYTVDRLMYLIAIQYPQANIAQVRANLRGSDLRRRSNAVELLDTLLSLRQKELLLPLLEGTPERIRTTAARLYSLSPQDMQQWYTELVKGSDPWLAACALFSLVSKRQVGLSYLIPHGLQSSDILVRETALLAASHLLTCQVYEALLREFAAKESDPYLQEYASACLHSLDDTHNGGILMPVSTIERILLLRGVELFKEISSKELELIARLCTVMHYAPGDRLIAEGDLSDGLYILVEGEVEITVNAVGVIDNRRSGDVIGEIGVLANEPRTASCNAKIETTALFISQTDFWDLLEGNSSLAVSVIRVLVPKLMSYPGRK